MSHAADLLTKAAIDKGLLIEAGWLGMAAMAYPNGMGDTQREQLRTAFFAGAQHLYASIMNVLDDGSEPSEDDYRRMHLIHEELEAFIVEYAKAHRVPWPTGPRTPTQ